MDQTNRQTYHPLHNSCGMSDEPFFEWLTTHLTTTPDENHLAHIASKPEVYICDWKSAKDEELLSKNRIGYVLSLREVYGELTNGSAAVFSKLGILRIKSLFEDNGSSQDQKIMQAYDHLKKLYLEAYQSGKGLLIHCEAGCSRSPSLFAAFLCLNYPENFPSFRKAIEFIAPNRNLTIDSGLASNICRIFEIEIE